MPRDPKNTAVEIEFKPGEYICPKCKNKGIVWFVQNLELKVALCDCSEMREVHKLIKSSGLSDVIKTKRFDNFEITNQAQADLVQKAKIYLKEIIEGSARWFVVCGQSGSGKTHICSALARELLRRKKAVYYMLWREQADELNRFSKSASETEKQDEMFERIKTVEVLYIDDFLKTSKGEDGKLENPSRWDLELAFKIINTREVVGKPTIISTEWLIDELIKVDEAFTGRIYHNAGKQVVVVPRTIGNNYRMAGV